MKLNCDVRISKAAHRGTLGYRITITILKAALKKMGISPGSNIDIRPNKDSLIFRTNSEEPNFKVVAIGTGSYGIRCSREDIAPFWEKFCGDYNFEQKDPNTFIISTTQKLEEKEEEKRMNNNYNVNIFSAKSNSSKLGYTIKINLYNGIDKIYFNDSSKEHIEIRPRGNRLMFKPISFKRELTHKVSNTGSGNTGFSISNQKELENLIRYVGQYNIQKDEEHGYYYIDLTNPAGEEGNFIEPKQMLTTSPNEIREVIEEHPTKVFPDEKPQWIQDMEDSQLQMARNELKKTQEELAKTQETIRTMTVELDKARCDIKEYEEEYIPSIEQENKELKKKLEAAPKYTSSTEEEQNKIKEIANLKLQIKELEDKLTSASKSGVPFDQFKATVDGYYSTCINIMRRYLSTSEFESAKIINDLITEVFESKTNAGD